MTASMLAATGSPGEDAARVMDGAST